MLQEKTFFGLDNWKLYHSENIANSEVLDFRKEQIERENANGYLVMFEETQNLNNQKAINCYKKHSTAILKLILIGKFPIPEFNRFKKGIDTEFKQTEIIAELLKKPEFSKYKVQKKLYFNLD